ncbi:MAG TPA: bifunctional lysylphosphatidylglycerol flippase/synthetase MprF [Gemmatimonadaceae bacterium]|nr:bifunctional lysylphosphatidylglycerol flippase/synthetase MprF [Gemmatimonadaceae bacterium]
MTTSATAERTRDVTGGPTPPAPLVEAGREQNAGKRTPRRAAARALPVLLAVCLPLLALAVLHHELSAYRYRDIAHRVMALPRWSLALALALTAVDYALLVGYDALALRYVRCRLPRRRVAFASSIGYAISHTISLGVFTGSSIRYRFWSAWGLTAAQIARGLGFIFVTNTLGFVATCGAALALAAGTLPRVAGVPPVALRVVGLGLLALALAYIVASATVRQLPLRIRGWRLAMPGPGLGAAQIGTAVAEWVIASAVLYAILPPARGLTFPVFLGAFLLAQGAGILSYLPGGIGVFDTLMIVMLRPYVAAADAAGALVAYRVVYYLVPFALATATLSGYEIAQRRSGVLRLAGATRRWLPALAPDVLSAATFLVGAILLASGATPGVHGRLRWLHMVLPLGVIELSHFVASLAGVGLLLLAYGLRRRLDAAYHLTVVALAAGIGASLLKGGDWEEALALTGVLAVLVPARRHFYRRAALTSEPWSLGWVAAVALVLAGTLWLGFFSYKHVPYSDELWWRFALRGDAPRFLRASVGAVGLAVAVAFNRLLRPARPVLSRPTAGEVDRAARIAYESGCVDAYLAALGDKTLLFGQGGGLLMYAVSGRSWVALGDPVGAPDERAELAWQFKDLAERHAGWPVFYEVGSKHLPLYIDLGLTLLKLGEEARVPLPTFSLDGSGRRGLRRTVRDVERSGATFAIVPPEGVAELLPELRRVSDEWLVFKKTREKGFSLGYFDEAYLSRFPLAVVRCGQRVVAFANVWPGATREEISVDLMRHVSDAPHGVMDYIFVRLMLWAKEQGYEWFSLGMAPLSGLPARALAPLWGRVGGLLYRHGEHFYNFRGLRQYKEKFDPEWEPRYLAAPGGLALPRVLANITTLVSGGIAGVIAK